MAIALNAGRLPSAWIAIVLLLLRSFLLYDIHYLPLGFVPSLAGENLSDVREPI